jgi:hypothetical protein
MDAPAGKSANFPIFLSTWQRRQPPLRGFLLRGAGAPVRLSMGVEQPVESVGFVGTVREKTAWKAIRRGELGLELDGSIAHGRTS